MLRHGLRLCSNPGFERRNSQPDDLYKVIRHTPSAADDGDSTIVPLSRSAQ
jgi:hypothetical protein